MPIDRRSIKAAARERLRSATPRPCVEGLLFVLIAGALTVLSTAMLSSRINENTMNTYLKYIYSGLYEDAVRYLQTLNPPVPDYLISRVLDLLRSIVAAGLSLFALNTLREKDASLWNLLDGFARFFPLLLLIVLMRLLISFGYYLLIIPGVILSYRYRFAVYLLLDNPQLNPLQCLALSGRTTRGYKGALFLLDLSFLGWGVLALLPLSIGASFGLVPLILGAIVSCAILAWLIPYYELSFVGFYDAVKTPIESIPPTD